MLCFLSRNILVDPEASAQRVCHVFPLPALSFVFEVHRELKVGSGKEIS